MGELSENFRPLTDLEMDDARIRAAHESERWGYHVWSRLLERLDLAEEVLRSATTVEVQVGDDGETDEFVVVSGTGMEYWQASRGWNPRLSHD